MMRRDEQQVKTTRMRRPGSHRICVGVCYFLVAIWTLPFPVMFPGATVDDSWLLGINWAIQQGMSFGEEIIFTLGPLGFIWVPPLQAPGLWSLGLVIQLVVHGLLFWMCFQVVRRFEQGLAHYLVLLAMLLAVPFLSFTYKVMHVGVLALYLVLLDSSPEQRGGRWYLLGVGFLWALGSLVKFDQLILGVPTMLVFMALTLSRHERRALSHSALLLGSYVLSLVVLWLLSGQHLLGLWGYLRGGFELVRGYGEAMALEGPELQWGSGLCALMLFLLLTLYGVFTRKTELRNFMLLTLPFVYGIFKHSFVRHDLGHFLISSSYLFWFSLILLILLHRFGEKSMSKLCAGAGVILFLAIHSFLLLYFHPVHLENNLLLKWPHYRVAAELTTNSDAFHVYGERSKAHIREVFPCGEGEIRDISAAPVDVFPWDVAMCFAYDLSWAPRPVFQSYTAYTGQLDDTNARHLLEQGAPTILYGYKSIDDRYPLFDEPATLRALLQSYRYEGTVGEFLRLSRVEQRAVVMEEISQVEGELGEVINVPQYQGGEVFGYFTLSYSVWGKLMALFYKPSPVYVRFILEGGAVSPQYRVVRGLAGNGFLLGRYVSNGEELAGLFRSAGGAKVTGITLVAGKPSHFKKQLRVLFRGMRF